MTIIIAMNIYITRQNEERLKSLPGDQSMSGIINKLLDDYWAGKGTDLFPAKDIQAQHEALMGAKVPTADRYVQTPDGKVHGPTREWDAGSMSEVVHQTITEGEKMLRDMQDATAPDKKKWAEVKPNRPDPDLGYPCCTKKTPCKHWAWESDQEAWVNNLTGKTREAD